ncbi:hypothetical protein ACFU3E_13330 [Streptomyces sp. NPDC057424]|uniref:hypothetical protein n=1 Tax=Streptomyces sp. NPDC057424 TaxID=3346127 RepID=UPI0036A30622
METSPSPYGQVLAATAVGEEWSGGIRGAGPDYGGRRPRSDTNRLHDAAGGDFHLAKITEHEARETCVHELEQVYDLLPDFRMGFIQRVDVVSPTLRDIRLQTASLPGAQDSYRNPPSTAQGRADWIAANKEIIKAAAPNVGLPPDMVAGIAWQEVGGQPGILDDMTEQLKAESEFAARYNGGPYWETDDAQDYGRRFANNLDEPRNALR